MPRDREFPVQQPITSLRSAQCQPSPQSVVPVVIDSISFVLQVTFTWPLVFLSFQIIVLDSAQAGIPNTAMTEQKEKNDLIVLMKSMGIGHIHTDSTTPCTECIPQVMMLSYLLSLLTTLFVDLG